MEADNSIWAQFYSFLQAVGWHWFIVIFSIGTPLVVDMIISACGKKWPNFKANFHSYFTYTRKVALVAALAICSVFYAGFQAWQDEHAAKVQHEQREKEALRLPPTGQQARISELERELGAANAKILAMEDQAAHRKLTEEMKAYLISTLKDYKGTNIRVIQSPSIEATSFTSQIVDVLKEAGWEVSDTLGKAEEDSMIWPFAGNELYVLAKPGKRVEGPPLYLLKALKCVGVRVVPMNDKNLKPGQMKLYIGDKSKGDKLAFDQGCNSTR